MQAKKITRILVKWIAHSVRPWGEFYSLHKGPGWCLKTIHIKPKKRLSLQYHNQRSEYWMLVEGDATATTRADDNSLVRKRLVKNELFHVPLGMHHRLESKKGGVVVEIAMGDFDENDIVRIEDDFGRR